MIIIIFLLLLKLILLYSNSIDLNVCKITHAGTEYIGKLTRTESNVTCQYWNSATAKGSEGLIDEAFPEKSKAKARNYCRNPTKDPKGPWCYTTKKTLIFDTCDVPLCKSSDCRISGTGMEYAGSIDVSSSGKKCTKWKDTHTLKPKTKETPFKNRFFPDGSTGGAGRKCRNPDGNVSGPWCYVEREDANLHAKELCDIPFCDDLGDFMYSEGSASGQYFFFSSLNVSTNFTISFRLWDPGDWLSGQIYLYLSAYDVPLNREEISQWNSGVEILISHAGSAILSEENTVTDTPLILSGAKWTDLEITWTDVDNSSLIIQVFEKPKIKPIAISAIQFQNSIFEIESFRFFSLSGSPGLWDVKSSEDDCSVHTVSRVTFTRFWLMKKTTLGMDIDIFVRAKNNAIIMLRTAPMVEDNQVQITIGNKDNIQVSTYITGHIQEITETTRPKILNFWKWEFFKISLLKEKLQIYWVRSNDPELILETSHPNIENVMWVAFASPSVSYWAIYCDPRGAADPPPASLPECIFKQEDLFNGTLSVTQQGRQCIPWTDTRSIPEEFHDNKLFEPYGGKVTCQNFCRNLNKDPKGAFCFVRDDNDESSFVLEYCNPRFCNEGDCKIAGTGNDYLGKLNVTRSKRQCKAWEGIVDKMIRPENFPDPTIKDAKNYCRNPNKNLAGSWCYTTDETVPQDLCLVRDCDKPLACTMLLSGQVKESYFYIFPSWRKFGLKFWLKSWNPDLYEGLVVTMFSIDYLVKYILLIGDEKNEKVKLIYKREEKEIILEHKTLPHLVPTGKWGGYWLRTGKGKIELGYYGVSNSFFEWISTDELLSFEPMFISLETILDHWVGVNFDCTECLLIKTSASEENKIFPIDLWKEKASITSLRLNIRGSGTAVITLMWSLDFDKHLALKVSSHRNEILIVQFNGNGVEQNLATYKVPASFEEDKWSEYIISFTEKRLIVTKHDFLLFKWTSPFPLLLYWFSVSADEGTIIWSANCPTKDIDGPPRDGSWGKWGPWTCSVTCGGGEGRVSRKCNNPTPNVYGKLCKGSSIYEGPCNTFPCGEISPDTQKLIRKYLSSQHKALTVNAKEKVVLTCNAKIISLITAQVPDVNITWTHNGSPHSKTKLHMNDDYNLVISHAREKHNGVYLCVANQEERVPSKVVLEVISLVVVKSVPSKKIRKGRSMNLKCNGLALSYVYADLSQRWELNGTLWKDYGMETLSVYTIDKLENIGDTHDGVWTCVIIQEDFRFRWTTNWIHLKVISAPSFWSYLMEDETTAPLFGKLGNEKNVKFAFFLIVTILLAVIITASIFLMKWLYN